MKNKALKNLIFLFVLAISVFSANSALATSDYYNFMYDTVYPVRDNYTLIQQEQARLYNYKQAQLQIDNQISQQKYYNDQQKLLQDQNIALQKQYLASIKNNGSTYSSTYVQPATQIQYVPQQQIQAVTQPLSVSYVPANAQAASVLGSTSKAVYPNAGVVSSTGQYVNYDANSLGASAYGYSAYSNNPQVVTDPNGVTALSMNGSGGFLPTSIFQWFMFILLILAIVIIARIIIKKNSMNNAHAVPAH